MIVLASRPPNWYLSNTFCVSTGQYIQVFQNQPTVPLHSLCVGLTFIHMASQKYVDKRHTLVMQVVYLFVYVLFVYCGDHIKLNQHYRASHFTIRLRSS